MGLSFGSFLTNALSFTRRMWSESEPLRSAPRYGHSMPQATLTPVMLETFLAAVTQALNMSALYSSGCRLFVVPWSLSLNCRPPWPFSVTFSVDRFNLLAWLCSTVRRPSYLPSALARASPVIRRSRIIAHSNSVNTPNMCCAARRG
jgi:hypothetical protein